MRADTILLTANALGFCAAFVQFSLAQNNTVKILVPREERGNPIYPPAARVLREAGYTVPARSAHRATKRELAESGLILAMTTGHARALRRMCADAGVDAARVRRRDGGGEREVGTVDVGVDTAGAVERLDVGVAGGCGRRRSWCPYCR